MTFFENELRKILIPQYPETTFVGRAAYVRLSDANRAKIQFVSTNIASHYDALRLTILNREEGDVDNLLLRFSDLLDKKMVSNPNIRDGVDPHAWTYNRKTEWYAYHPNSHDYRNWQMKLISIWKYFRNRHTPPPHNGRRPCSKFWR